MRRAEPSDVSWQATRRRATRRLVANGVESPPRGVARGEWSGVCARRCGVWSTAGSFLACLPPIGSSLASPRAVYSCSRVVGVRQRPCERRT